MVVQAFDNMTMIGRFCLAETIKLLPLVSYPISVCQFSAPVTAASSLEESLGVLTPPRRRRRRSFSFSAFNVLIWILAIIIDLILNITEKAMGCFEVLAVNKDNSRRFMKHHKAVFESFLEYHHGPLITERRMIKEAQTHSNGEAALVKGSVLSRVYRN